MIDIKRSIIASLIFLAFALPAVAFSAPVSEDDEELDAVHHVADGYYLDFTPGPKVYLPRIFLVRKADGGIGLNFFGSTQRALDSGLYHYVEPHADAGHDQGAEETHEGEDSVDSDHSTATGQTAAEAADHTAEAGQDEHAEEHSEDAILMPIGGSLLLDLSITRHLVFSWIIAILTIVLFTWLARRYTSGIGRETAPQGKLQNAMEALITYVRDDIARPNIGVKADKYVPYLLTLWFFILGCNLIGLVPLSATSTANITVTAVLAIFTFIVTNASGTKDYWKHIFWPPGVPLPVKFILVPIEFIGIFIKPFVLAVRLFANMTAGHLVILSLLGLIFSFKNLYGVVGGYAIAPVSVAFALFIYLIEVLVAFLQAYIFVMLSALYIGTAVEEHDHHDHPSDDHQLHAPLFDTEELSVSSKSGGRRAETEPVLAG